VTTENSEHFLDLHQKYVLGTYSPAQLVLNRGSMAKLYDVQGNEYLDFTSGIGVCNLGHCHPRVTEAIQRQAAKLVHTSNLFANENQPKLAHLISEHTFGGKLFFCNSGAEANEGMIKFARKWGQEQGRYEMITMDNSFHGRTLATLAATGREKYRKGFQPDLEGFVHTPFNDIESVKKAVSDKTAAVLVEPIQGEGGVIPAQPEFLRQLRQLCDDKGILLLFDEVQCGMGRTTDLFAHKTYGVTPDATAMAKALGNGFPIGAFEVAKQYGDVLTPGTHASTFGGSPLAAAAGIAVIETIFEEGLLQNCEKMAAQLWGQLHQLKNNNEHVKDLRGSGLMIGLELDSPVGDVLSACRNKGLLALPAGQNVLRLLPPLIIENEHISQAVETIEEALKALDQQQNSQD